MPKPSTPALFSRSAGSSETQTSPRCRSTAGYFASAHVSRSRRSPRSKTAMRAPSCRTRRPVTTYPTRRETICGSSINRVAGSIASAISFDNSLPIEIGPLARALANSDILEPIRPFPPLTARRPGWRRHVHRGLGRRSRARLAVEHGDRAAVLRPAGKVVAGRNPALAPVGDEFHALRGHALVDEIVAHRLGAAIAERHVLRLVALFVRMPFDRPR